MKARAHLLITGRVQGVFFRSETKREADKRGVRGWVKNLRDGGVEVVLEGEEEAIKQVITFCRRGPSYARVKSVEVKWEPFKDEFHDFSIRWNV